MTKKGFCIYYFSHRGIGKIIMETEDYKKLPEPSQDNSAKQESKDKINKILKITKTQSTKKKSSSVEQSIINKIRK